MHSFVIFGYGVYFARKNIGPRKRSYKRFGDRVFLFLHAEAGDEFFEENINPSCKKIHL